MIMYMMLATVLIMTVVHRVKSGHPEGSWTEDNTLRGILSDGSLFSINVATGLLTHTPSATGASIARSACSNVRVQKDELNSVVGLTLDGADLSLSAFDTGTGRMTPLANLSDIGFSVPSTTEKFKDGLDWYVQGGE